MTTIESEEVTINASQQSLHDFISNLNNIIKILPADKIENWEGNRDSCSFTIKGLSRIGLEIKRNQDLNKITLSAHGKNPFDFTLIILINKIEDKKSISQIIFSANMNAMIELMAKKPLTNLFNIMSQNLKKQFN